MNSKEHLIIMETAELFMQNGIKKITMDDIAKNLKMSKKTLYKYFKDKDHLVNSIILIKLEEDKCLLDSSVENTENAIQEFIKMNTVILEHYKNMQPQIIYDLYTYHKESWKIIHNHKWTYARNQIKNMLIRGINEKIFRKDINVEIVSRLYIASTEAITNPEIFTIHEFTQEEIYIQNAKLFMGGLVNKNGLKILLELKDENKNTHC